jgi:MipA family protein
MRHSSSRGTPQHTQRALSITLLLVAAAIGSCAVRADDRPLWEVGVGPGVLAFNDYRGAAASHVYPLPVPYFVYRGDLLKVDREGLRGLLFHQDRVEFNLSGDITTPVRNDAARQGMPNLRSTFEIGPEIDVHLWRSADRRFKLDLRLPASAAITIAADPHRVGTIYDPHLALDIAQYRGETGWKLGLLAGPLYADRRYNSYYYTVAPQYATPTRPAYDAPGGYAGVQTLVSLTRRFPTWWFGFFARHDSLAGASFAASPLVQRDSYWFTGFGFAWILAQSDHMVTSEE